MGACLCVWHMDIRLLGVLFVHFEDRNIVEEVKA